MVPVKETPQSQPTAGRKEPGPARIVSEKSEASFASRNVVQERFLPIEMQRKDRNGQGLGGDRMMAFGGGDNGK